jgi:hypothetical protein
LCQEIFEVYKWSVSNAGCWIRSTTTLFER